MSIQLYSKHGIASGIVDESDSDLANFYWGLSGKKGKKYVYRRYNGKFALLHRVIMERVLNRKLLRNEEVDHENDNPLDNRRENLRLANRSQNMANTKLRATNTSGYKGVYKDKLGKWVARVTYNYRTYSVGRYDTPELAYEAYCEKAKELFGEFFNAG